MDNDLCQGEPVIVLAPTGLRSSLVGEALEGPGFFTELFGGMNNERLWKTSTCCVTACQICLQAMYISPGGAACPPVVRYAHLRGSDVGIYS